MENLEAKKFNNDPTPINQTESGSLTYTKKDIDDKFKDVNYLLLGVVVILLVMVATLIIDSFHINSAIYKEYSQKTESIEITQKANEELLKQLQELSQQAKEDRAIIKQLLNK